MKRKILLVALLGAAVSLSLAETKTVHGKYTNKTGQRTDITGVSATTDLILDSTPNESANQGEMYRAANKTVKSITAIDTSAADGKGAVNIASSNASTGITVDANSATDATAVSAASWKQNFMTLVLTNSSNDYKKANITVDFGSNLTLTGAAPDQSQVLSFEHFNGTVSAKNTYLSNSSSTNTTTLSISEDSSVIWDGGRLETGSANKSLIQVGGNLTLKGNSNTVFYVKGGEFIIGENGTLKSYNNTLYIANNATTHIYGTLEMGGGSTLSLYGKTYLHDTTPAKQFTVYKLYSNSEFVQATATSNNGVRFKRASNIETGASWTVDGIVDVFGEKIGSNELSITRAVLNVASGANFIVKKEGVDNAKIRLWGNSELNIWQENAFTDENGKGIRLATALDKYSEYGSLVNLYATQTFQDLYVTSGSNIEIYLFDLAQLILEGEGQTLWNNTEEGLKVYNFRENAVYVGTNAANASGVAKAKFYDADGNLLTNVRIGENGWLTAAIPEPAEWAAIFGAIALGFAVCRRRK